MAEGLIGYARCEELLKKIKETNAELKGLELSLSLSVEECEQLCAQEWYADIKKRLDDEAEEKTEFPGEETPKKTPKTP